MVLDYRDYQEPAIDVKEFEGADGVTYVARKQKSQFFSGHIWIVKRKDTALDDLSSESFSKFWKMKAWYNQPIKEQQDFSKEESSEESFEDDRIDQLWGIE